MFIIEHLKIHKVKITPNHHLTLLTFSVSPKICFFIIVFTYFWLHWAFAATCGLPLVAASEGYSALWYVGFSLWWLLLLRSTGSRHTSFSSCGSVSMRENLLILQATTLETILQIFHILYIFLLLILSHLEYFIPTFFSTNKKSSIVSYLDCCNRKASLVHSYLVWVSFMK